MLRLGKPSRQAVGGFLEDQRRHELSYAEVGATATVPPSGYVVDHTRNTIGRGEKAFLAAQAALERWQQFELGWLQAEPKETPLEAGAVVAVAAHAAGLWMLNACRIVYVVDESDETRRFGFAYGTLPEHVARGEERFLVEWSPATGDVWYDIFAFSQPRHVLAKLGYPVVRHTQRRFARESTAAMRRAVESAQAADRSS